MIYKIEFRPAVSRQLKKLSKGVQDWVFDVAERLALNPMPPNSQTVVKNCLKSLSDNQESKPESKPKFGHPR